MKKLLFLIAGLVIAGTAWGAQWDKTTPCKTGVGSCASADLRADYPADQQANNESIDRMLSNYREGVTLSYSSASAISVSAGEIMVSNSDGSVRLMLKNSTASSVTFSSIDTGSEASSTTYYLYAGTSNAADTSATFYISASSTAPSSVTYYKRLGSFYNDSSSNIQRVDNDNNVYASGFGAFSAKTSGVTYQATSDGMFHCYLLSDSASNLCRLFSDSSSTPTTEVSRAYANYGVNVSSSLLYPIRKGEYYKFVGEGAYYRAGFIPFN